MAATAARMIPPPPPCNLTDTRLLRWNTGSYLGTLAFFFGSVCPAYRDDILSRILLPAVHMPFFISVCSFAISFYHRERDIYYPLTASLGLLILWLTHHLSTLLAGLGSGGGTLPCGEPHPSPPLGLLQLYFLAVALAAFPLLNRGLAPRTFYGFALTLPMLAVLARGSVNYNSAAQMGAGALVGGYFALVWGTLVTLALRFASPCLRNSRCLASLGYTTAWTTPSPDNTSFGA